MDSPDAALYARLVALVDARLHDPDFRVEHIAEALHLSPRHLRRLVVASTGRSARDLLRQRRIARARALLADETRRVADVARTVGYTDASAFGRAFRAITGTTPRADRSSPAASDVGAHAFRMAGSAQPEPPTFAR